MCHSKNILQRMKGTRFKKNLLNDIIIFLFIKGKSILEGKLKITVNQKSKMYLFKF